MFIYKISDASVSVDDPITDIAADMADTAADMADTATSAETQQVYIGSTTETLKRRMSRHHYKAKIFGNRKLYAAMNQSGGDWKIEMLKDCGIVTKAELLQEELRFINEYDSIRRGLNTLRPIKI